MLDNYDKKILFELERNARIPHTQLAKHVRLSKDSIRYRIQKLEDAQIITGYKTWIDYAKLGYMPATLYFRLRKHKARWAQLIADVSANPQAYWLGIAQGVWDVGVTYFVKSPSELLELKNTLQSTYENIILDLTVTFLVGVSTHEKRFLDNKGSTLITFTHKTQQLSLDDIGKSVLRILYTNANARLVDIARRCETTVDIVRSRMQSLEEQEIIIRYSATIDYQKLGYAYYKIFIYLAKHSKKDISKLMTHIENSETIINVVQQIAPWDYELIIFAKSFADYTATVEVLTEIDPSLFERIELAIMSTDKIFPCEKALI